MISDMRAFSTNAAVPAKNAIHEFPVAVVGNAWPRVSDGEGSVRQLTNAERYDSGLGLYYAPSS